MAIYNNDKKIATIYRGDSSIGTVSYGNDRVFSGYIFSEEYIEIKVDASDGTYIVPLSSYSAHETFYALTIYVNGVYYGDYTGTSDRTTGTGVELSGLTGTSAIIKIVPTNGVNVGWGKAFGYFNNSSGCNVSSNKAKLLRVINDPDYAYVDSLTSVGHNFRHSQYYGCTLLRRVPAESMPDSIRSIGYNFRHSQYYGCSSLETVPAEVLPDSVTSIDVYFRYYQYGKCESLTATSVEVIPNSIKVINDYFKTDQYYGCISLTNVAAEVLPDNVTSIGLNFRAGQYQNCVSLTTAPVEVLPDSVTTVSSHFRASQYRGCISLKNAPSEVFPGRIISIGSYFRAYQYADCSSLTSTVAEVLPDSITVGNTYIRDHQYYNCTSLLIGNHIHSYQFAAFLNFHAYAYNYRHMFYVDSEKSDADTLPRYYTDSSQNATVPITDLIPRHREYYLTNRIGIPEYDSLDSNWK